MTKRLLSFLLGLALVAVAWYGFSRLLAPSRAVRVSELGATNEAPQADNTIRVGVYNIAHGRGGKFGASNWSGLSRAAIETRLERIALQAKTAKLDILVLNEADFQSSWSRSLNQAKVIAAGSGLRYVTEQRNLDVSLPFRTYRFGNAILSRFPISNPRRVRFPPYSRLEAALAGNHDGLVAELLTPEGPVRVLAVHLEYRSEEIRRRCAAVIRELAIESDTPLLAMGDYNTIPRFARSHQVSREPNNALDLLLDSGVLAASNAEVSWGNYVTFPSEAPDRAIDWILASPTLELGPPVVITSNLSDHLMVTAEIRSRKAP